MNKFIQLVACILMQYILNFSFNISLDIIAVFAVVFFMENKFSGLFIFTVSILADTVASTWLLGSHLIGFSILILLFEYTHRYYQLCSPIQRTMANILVLIIIKAILFLVNYVCHNNCFSLISSILDFFIFIPILTYYFHASNISRTYLSNYE